MNGYGYNTGGALYGPQSQRSDAMTLALMGGQGGNQGYTQPAQQGGMNPMAMAMMGNNMFGGGAGGAAAGGGGATGGSAAGGGGMSALGAGAGIAALVGLAKGYEHRNSDSTMGKLIGRFNAPTFNQIQADPKTAGLGVLTGAYPLMYDDLNKEAKTAKPEWEELLGY